MPVLMPTRRRAEDFARLLDASETSAVTSAALPRLVPLLSLAHQLQELPLGPAPVFRDRLRSRIVAVATVSPPIPRPLPPIRTPRRRVLAPSWVAGALVVVLALGGLWTASSRALPGDLLYGVKRATESVQLSLAGSASERGMRELQFAAVRLGEIDQLVKRRDGRSEVAPTFAAMDHSTQVGTQLLLRSYADTKAVASLRALDNFTTHQQQRLTTVLPSLPTPVRSRAKVSLVLLRQVGAKVNGLLASACSTGCAPSRSPQDGPSAPAGLGGATTTPTASVTPSATATGVSSASPDASASASPSESQGVRGGPAPSARPSRAGSPARPESPGSGVLGGLLGLLGGTQSSPSPGESPGAPVPSGAVHTPGPTSSAVNTAAPSPSQSGARSPFRLPLRLPLAGLFGAPSND